MRKTLTVIGIIIVVLVAAYLVTMAALSGQVRAAYAARKAAGQPTTLAELAKHKDASNGDASRLLAEAQSSLDTSDKTIFARADSNQLSPEETRTFLARNARSLQLLMQASRYPARCLFSNPEEGAAAKIEMTLHSWSGFLRLLHVQARDLLAQNKADEAMDVCLAGLRFSDLLAADQMSLYVLVQFLLDRTTMSVMQEVAPHCSDAALARDAAAVAALHADKDLVPAWSAEAIMFTNCLEKPKLTELAMWGMDNPAGAFFYMFGPTNRLSLIEYSRSIRRCIELSALPWYKTRTVWDSMDAAVKQIEARHSPLTFVYLGEPKMVPNRAAQYQAIRAVTLAGFRVLQYQRQHGGALPATLSATASDIAVDPYTGKPLIYRIAGTTFKLYSPGLDLNDDGGDPAKDVTWKMGS